jgi:hypothetical protein
MEKWVGTARGRECHVTNNHRRQVLSPKDYEVRSDLWYLLAWLTFHSADELRHILDDPDSQSPDIGPPPVSRFESDEPITFNANTAPSEERAVASTETSEPALPSNLETRRKRRESGGAKPNIRRVSLFESPPEETSTSDEATSKPAKTGSKRKFSVQEDEEKAKNSVEAFRFSRRSVSAPIENTKSGDLPRPQSAERPALSSSKFCIVCEIPTVF